MDERELQKQCEEMVHHQVYVCQSSLVDELLRKGFDGDCIDGFTFEEIENMRSLRDDSDLAYDYEDAWRVWNWIEELQSNHAYPDFLDFLTAQHMPMPHMVYWHLEHPDATVSPSALKEVVNQDPGRYEAIEYLKELLPDDLDEWGEIEDKMVDIAINRNSIDTFAEYLEHIEGVDEDELFEENEIYEWWIVSDWLERKLKGKGEAILDNNYGTWWGRRTTGQSIAMDGVIREIVEEHEAEMARYRDPSS